MRLIILTITTLFLISGCGGGTSSNEWDDSSNRNSTHMKFCVDTSQYDVNICTQTVNASVVKQVKNIETKYGTKTIKIWLEDNNNDLNSKKIDTLANYFLKDGLNNDIYDWVTNIYNKEWGDDAEDIDDALIKNDNTINILLYNMNTRGLAGFFWPKDNFKKSYVLTSNEKIMFYINTEVYAVNEKEVITTLGHEFQHMIHFYQRNILKDLKDSTWLDELMSETTEDFLATKIGYKGPRNVDPNDGSAGKPGNKGGRYPYFNKKDTRALTNWHNDLSDYGKVSSFGAFLARNYGGAKLFHDMLNSDSQDEDAIVDAVTSNNHIDTSKFSTNNDTFTINEENQIIRILDTKDKNITIHNDLNKEIFVVITSHYDNQTVSISTDDENNLFRQYKISRKVVKEKEEKIPEIMAKIHNFRENIDKYLTREHKMKKRVVANEVDEKVFNYLLNMWAGGVVLSSKILDESSNKPVYNFGDFKETSYDDVTYKLGSINFFYYIPQPVTYSSKTLNKNGNMYYKLGSNLSGDIKIKVNIPKGADITIIAK